MNLIVAVDEEWGIGKGGDLLRRISTDMKRFRAMTTRNILVIGRKTLESFPGGKPLPNRHHVVLTKNAAYQADGVTLCYDLRELPEILASFSEGEIFVAGGGSVYEQLLPQCEKAFVTKIHHTFPADTHFPNLDEAEDWERVEEGELQQEGDIRFSFDIYQRKK